MAVVWRIVCGDMARSSNAGIVCRAGLNKGEAGNKLARAVFFHERGEIRDGSFESQAFRASGLNLVVSAIVLPDYALSSAALRWHKSGTMGWRRRVF